MNRMELISFDVWETLLTPNPAYGKKRAVVVRDTLAPSLAPEDIHKAIKDANKVLGVESVKTGIQYGFEDRTRLAWSMLPEDKRIGELTPDLLEFLDQRHGELAIQDPPLLVEEDAVSVMKELRDQALRLAIVSNTGNLDGKHMRLVFDVLGFGQYLDHALFSNEVGVAKPDRAIFDKLSEVSGVKHDRILHIGDDINSDYRGARNAGLNSLLYTSEPVAEAETIRHLRELLKREDVLG